MLLHIRQLIFVFISLILLDFAWIKLNSSLYIKMFSSIQNKSISLRPLQLVLVYIFIIIIFSLYIIPEINENTKEFSVKYLMRAGILGICIYGIYNFTNFTIFDKYNWNIAIIDTIWGGILFTIIAYLVKLFSLLTLK